MIPQRLVVGFLPLLDCAPLVVAVEKGFAAAEGLEIELIRETSWANIRDRVIVGQFHAAHMLGPMAIASTLGIAHLKVPMIAPLAMGAGGNAITVSTALAQGMQAAGAALGSDPKIQGAALKRVVHERAQKGESPLTLAMVYPFSAHNYELRYWLAASGIDPDRDVRLIVIPPPYMVDALRSNQIDGFCSGEPWNSLGVAEGAGTIVTATTAIWRRSPEKVLGMRADWAERHESAAQALVRAVYQGARWCSDPTAHTELAALLSRPEYVGESAAVIRRGLEGQLVRQYSTAARLEPEFLMFADSDATVPWPRHALWFYSQMVRWKQVAPSVSAEAAARATYRPEWYSDALAPLGVDLPPRGHNSSDESFFDGRTFDANDVAGYLKSLD